MKRNWIRKAINGLSFTTALFIFQACYGTPQDLGMDVYIAGQVKSKSTGEPIKGIRVSVENGIQYEVTDDQGRFSFYTERIEQMTVKFEDVDESENGLFQNADSLLTNFSDNIVLNINLEDK